MKVVLSRKGFDSQYGGYPSPIMPDESMVSLPIPSNDPIRYSDLNFSSDLSYYDMMNQLKGWIKSPKGKRELTSDTRCHLDPDLKESVFSRKNGWKPIFGQVGAAQSHLDNQAIKEGDLFLFFGTFRKTEYDGHSNLRFISNSPEFHAIYGYLQIGDILKIDEKSNVPNWMKYHPHADGRRLSEENNTIYVAKDKLSFANDMRGAGTFEFDERLMLTKEGLSKSRWNLDSAFKDVDISYHSDDDWKEDYFASVNRGQEFVIDCNREVEKYVIDLMQSVS